MDHVVAGDSFRRVLMRLHDIEQTIQRSSVILALRLPFKNPADEGPVPWERRDEGGEITLQSSD